MPLPDGEAPVDTTCWDGLLCKDGALDQSMATPSALAVECKAQNDSLDPFGCVEQILCLDGKGECDAIFKAAKTPCWTADGADSEQCIGHSCEAAGKCVVDESLSTACGDDSYPEECGEECQACTQLMCHWIPDPDGGESPAVKVKYCRASADLEAECSDGNGCTVGDACVLKGQAEGPLGKETLGECVPGTGKTKEECLDEMELPPLSCLKAGIVCDLAEGCSLDQAVADAWCAPPGVVCYSKMQTFCTHIDIMDGKWNPDTGCHLVVLDQDGCNDGNVCTADECDFEQGCVNTPEDGLPCDDGAQTTVEDQCLDGTCSGFPDPDLDGIANAGHDAWCKGGSKQGCNDNCPDTPNPSQADSDNDGQGDACTCSPDCAGKQCGPDGCGGSCGACPPNHVCTIEAQCLCLPSCVGKACGPDGCGGQCGICPDNNVCTIDGECVCIPDCTGLTCGDNGCGGICGTCPAGWLCEKGFCQCQPSCQSKECGDDGCGGSCGTCTGAGEQCVAGECVLSCVPVNGGWSDYVWSPCSETCGGGTQTGTRYCNSPAPSCGGAPCAGSNSMVQACNTQPCCTPVNGGWSAYACGSCTKQCGGGQRICTRECNNPPPSCGGAGCSGSDTLSEPCNTQPCLPTTCGSMEMWKECTVAQYVSGIHGDDTNKEACAISCGEMQALCAKYIWYSDDPETGAVCVCHSAHGTGPSSWPFEQGNSFGWKIWAAECY
jgi:hypothetical protein